MAFAVVVGGGADPLAAAVATSLAAREFDVQRIDALELALEQVDLTPTTATVAGRVVDAAVFLAEPAASFGGDFDAEDRDFCNAEVRAIWLALLNLPSVVTITRWRAEEWSSLGEWAIWRRRLIAAGVSCSPLAFGAVANGDGQRWLPFSSSHPHSLPGDLGRRVLVPAVTTSSPRDSAIWCCGDVAAGVDSAIVRKCGAVLEAYGTRLAAITLDEKGSVFACASRLDVFDPTTAAVVGERIAQQLHADLPGR